MRAENLVIPCPYCGCTEIQRVTDEVRAKVAGSMGPVEAGAAETQQLVNMGFPETKAVNALRCCRNDVNAALERLLMSADDDDDAAGGGGGGAAASDGVAATITTPGAARMGGGDNKS